jgi:glycosyltransferase involved in cell wall biosynthesis
MAVLYLFVFITCFVQIAFFLFIFTHYLRLDTSPPAADPLDLRPVSVVICAKNEAENIKKYLPDVLEQHYPQFEVIVIDDASTDATGAVLQDFEQRFDNLLSFRIEPEDQLHGGKKQALSHGVALARHDWIVVTDADCRPASDQWLAQMAAGLAAGGDIVLGVSPYFPAVGLARRFFRVESLFIALQYINFLLAGMPFMGVGRNMAYRKEVFESHDMKAHYDLVSGDDDLLINDLAGSVSIDLSLNASAYTHSESPGSLQEWFRQKMRHYSTGYRYNLLQKVWLAYYWTSSALLYILIPVALGYFREDLSQGAFLLALLGITALIRWIVLAQSLRKLGAQKISLSVPIFDLAYILSLWIISPLSGFGRNRWK